MSKEISQTGALTVPKFLAKKKSGEKISMITAYDFTMAKLFDEAGVDSILIGDSLGMVIQGRENTLGVSLDQMIYHCHCVAMGAKRAHLIGDMPFMSYQASKEDAVRSAGKLLKKGKVHGVKMEGGEEIAEIVAAVVKVGIPVMGHVGLMPQHVQQMGGYKVQGREEKAAKKILNDAKAIANAGAYSLVLEGIPLELAQKITDTIDIPTIGIGSGPHCDGQVLVCYDLLGMYSEFKPKFVKHFGNLGVAIHAAMKDYIREVKEGTYPDEDHSFKER
ncbi:MAG: 3-methyl-2-oxobutanoate hydroxymethyltransferase [Deltaproteobacteria bacterium]|nr:3-methyl-2-oxobutanoate hydroxymethyltransferase [Deltaproteobacteria bacterium]